MVTTFDTSYLICSKPLASTLYASSKNGQLQEPFSQNSKMHFIPNFYLMRSHVDQLVWVNIHLKCLHRHLITKCLKPFMYTFFFRQSHLCCYQGRRELWANFPGTGGCYCGSEPGDWEGVGVSWWTGCEAWVLSWIWLQGTVYSLVCFLHLRPFWINCLN